MKKINILLFSFILIYPCFNNSVDNDDFVRSKLGFPDVKAQKSAGLSKILPIRTVKIGATKEKMSRSASFFPASMTKVGFVQGKLISQFCNNSTITYEIDKILKLSNEEIDTLFKSISLADHSYRDFLENYIQSHPKDSNSMDLLDGHYIYAINEAVELRVMPASIEQIVRVKGIYVDEESSLTLKERFYKVLLNLAVKSYLSEHGLKLERITHDTLVGGKNILVAGELKIKNGKIISMSDYSGHYQPYPWHLYYGIKALMDKEGEKYFADNFEIIWRDQEHEDIFMQKKPWSYFKSKKPWAKKLEELNKEALNLVFSQTKLELTEDERDDISKQVLKNMGLSEVPEISYKLRKQEELSIVRERFNVENNKILYELRKKYEQQGITKTSLELHNEAMALTFKKLLEIANNAKASYFPNENDRVLIAYMDDFKNDQLPIMDKIAQQEYRKIKSKLDEYRREYDHLAQIMLAKKVEKRARNREQYSMQINRDLPIDQQMDQLRDVVKNKLQNKKEKNQKAFAQRLKNKIALQK